MIQIDIFLNKFKNNFLKEENKKKIIQEIILKNLKIKIKKNNIKIKENIVFLKTKPIYKNEIFINKENIIFEINRNLNLKIKDIF